MTNLSRFINSANDDADISKKEIDIIMDKICNSPMLLTTGRQDRKLNAANIKIDNDEFTSASTSDAKRTMIQNEIENLSNSTDLEAPYTDTKNFGNLWTFLLTKSNSAIFTVNQNTEDENFNTQLEDYLISPKISYYDESDAFSTKRDVIRSYEKIIYSTKRASEDIKFSVDIFKNIDNGLYDITTPGEYINFKNIDNGLYDITTPGEYINISIPLRYTYLHLLENNYTIFNDERDILLRSVFNNTINYVSENELYKLTEKISRLVIKRAKKEHDDYIQNLNNTLKEALGEAGNSIIDFSKLFNDVSGDYVGQLNNVNGKIIELTKELFENYKFDIASDKINITRIFKDIVNEAVTILIKEGVQTISSIEDLRHFEYIYLLMKFFKYNTTVFTNFITQVIETYFNAVLSDAKKMREKEGKFLTCFLESTDKNKYTYTEEFIHLYHALKR